MIIQKIFVLLIAFQSLFSSIEEQFKIKGYVETCDNEPAPFDSLYAHFDEFIEFLQMNPIFSQKLYGAKERFIRSKDRDYYSTDFFGLYDESRREGRNQIAFYYSTHFHEFIASQFSKVPEIICFLEACRETQKAYESLVNDVAKELGLTTSILFKVIKYFPSYAVTRPHYDGSAFSIFLNSTDDQSLKISPYKASFTVEDFFSPNRVNSILIIPGTQLTEFSIDPTPHIVTKSGKTRYSTIAFAMRPNYKPQRIEFSLLPNFGVE